MKKLVFCSIFILLAGFSKAQMTSLMENFNVCDSNTQGHFPPGWSAYSVTGAQVWKCYTIYGVGGGPCIEVNGYSGGVDNVNEDWLITPKLNLSSYSTIFLNFFSEYKYLGDSLHIMVSNNYDSSKNPDSTIYSWTELSHPAIMADDSVSYRMFQVNLTPFKATPLNVGFKYTSSATSGSRWNLDSVFTSQTPVAIANVTIKKDIELKVLGNGTNSELRIFFSANAGPINISLFDLLGRKLADNEIIAIEGEQTFSFSSLNLSSGIYVVRIANENSVGVTKAAIR